MAATQKQPVTGTGPFNGILTWVDQRFPLVSLWKDHLGEYYAPKSFNFWYYFGSLALVVLVLQIVTGIFVAASLFLYETWRYRAVLFACMPFIVNAVIASISRSAFLAAGLGGLVFNLFTPKRFRLGVRVLSVLALVLFMMLTNPIYWQRIISIKYAGEQVEEELSRRGRQAAKDAAAPFGANG